MATTQLTSLSKLIDIPIESHYDESYIIRLGREERRKQCDSVVKQTVITQNVKHY